ncbi:MAG: hypothetical protein AAFU65_10675, partial [Pseudomonadota bacterium]
MHFHNARNAVKAIAILLSGLASLCAFGQVPERIAYQGYLSAADGSPVNGTREITFEIFAVGGGVPVWSDTQTVALDEGLFSVSLGGAANPLTAAALSAPVELQLTIEGEVLLPRRVFEAGAYSLLALVADDAQRVGGATAAQLDQSNEVSDLQAQIDALVAQLQALQLQVDQNAAQAAGNAASIGLANADIQTLAAGVADNVAADSALDNRTTQLEAALPAVDGRVAIIEGNSALLLGGIVSLEAANTVRLTGVNLQVVNGGGATASANGTGNVLVGYNEVVLDGQLTCSLGAFTGQTACEGAGGIWSDFHKTGSHNVIVGRGHNYSRFGGVVAGNQNTISGDYASVTGGRNNTARGLESAVAGGEGNAASGTQASVGGGALNLASGNNASVAGGRGGVSSGTNASIAGGQDNVASGTEAAVAGGASNDASGNNAAVLGGFDNEASADNASVAGGQGNLAGGDQSVALGGQSNQATGEYTVATGGRFNEAIGEYAVTVGGGGDLSGQANEVVGRYGVVVGGEANRVGTTLDTTLGVRAVVVGGK